MRLHLARALRRARLAIAWERIWPHLARLLTVIGLFLALSWAGLWLNLPLVWRAFGLALFAALCLAVLVPLARVRWPSNCNPPCAKRPGCRVRSVSHPTSCCRRSRRI